MEKEAENNVPGIQVRNDERNELSLLIETARRGVDKVDRRERARKIDTFRLATCLLL